MATTGSPWLCILPMLLFLFFWKPHRHQPYPPGPRYLPFLGHFLSMPFKDHETVFHKWSRTLGDVISLRTLGRSIVVLNSEQAANDLLDKRSAMYSDRPRFPMLELMGWTDGDLAFLPYAKTFFEVRKIFQHQLTRKVCAIFQDCQVRQASVLAHNLLNTPQDFEAHIQRFASSVVMEVAYGHQVSSPDDPYLKMANRIKKMIAGLGTQGTNPVDIFPFLKNLPAWFPGAWFIRYADVNRPEHFAMRRYGFDEVRKDMALGKAKPSFLSLNLEELTREGKEDKESLHLLEISAYHIYGAGGETTQSTLHILVLVLLLHPQVQQKAQAEIDGVVGHSRFPDFSDQESLPYVKCLMYESMRWHPVAPLGIPHRVMEDDIYRGMFIPKGSTVISNIRSMTLDEKTYRDPHTFFPERFLPRPVGFGEPFPQYVFGFGRRVCPGRHLAEASIWIALVTLLSAFDVCPMKDEDGKDIIPSANFQTAFTSHPVPFQCAFRPRSESSTALITGQ